MRLQFVVFGPPEALSDFAEVADAGGMTAERGRLTPLSAGITNAIEPLFVALKEHGALLAASLAMAQIIVTFLKGRADRRVTITKNEKERIVSIEAKGFGTEELAKILEDCRDVIVYSPPKEKRQPKDSKDHSSE